MICGKCGEEASGLYPKWVISGWNGKIYEPYYYWAHSEQYTGTDGKRHTRIKWHYMGKWNKFYDYYQEANREKQKYQRTHKEQYKEYQYRSESMTIDQAFNLIGITENSTPEEAKKAFRKVVFQFHPDREPDESKRAEATLKMQEINKAWEIIGKFYENRAK